MAPLATANTADCTHCSIVTLPETLLVIHLERLAAHDALEAAQVVNVGHGAHHQVVGGEHQAAPVTLHPEYPEMEHGALNVDLNSFSRARYY